MVVCSSCGRENPEDNRFCGECASPLAAPGRPSGQERKIVTSLFCDLIGFTAASEAADPEDVDRMLAAYFELARAEIERYGGTVEKFIGDAVVGVFGAPTAHEDDPERAVRTGLRIVDLAEELRGLGGKPIRLRVGINTGELLVRLERDVNIGAAGFLVGDAINTAARIQSIAPEMGVAVGLATYQATAAVFDYEELASAKLKGKSEPVRVFRARAPRARLGSDLTRTHDTSFVGREADLALLNAVFDKCIAESTVQLVTVVGEPGLGKSRIVAEFFARADARPELMTWRQGRCLPYGDGISFWALGEILKAHAGVLESDSPKVVSAKLAKVLPQGPEREWFRQRLLPLLGVEASSPANQEELFTCWRRFWEFVADERPTVLVFEDVHWADEALLAFLEHLAAVAEGVPLLVIATTRPELYERRPNYAAGIPNATSISLTPLAPEETTKLVSALLGTSALPLDVQRPILERAGGNPLYASEFARLLKDQELLVTKDNVIALRDGAEMPLPESLQALIAARLDTLDPEAKSLLADAAVIGKVFWAGALAATGERDTKAVRDTLRALSRKQLVRPVRESSVEGEVEYAFSHIFARDVAYQQLPRASRSARHVAAAAWLEAKFAGRVEDLADVLAYHYATASDLARAAGELEHAAALADRALRFLTMAGERALGLDATAALLHFERALALTPPDHADRPRILALFGEAAHHAGRLKEADEALEEAVDQLRARGDLVGAARAAVGLSALYDHLGDARRRPLLAEMLALLEPLPPSPELVAVLTQLADAETLGGRPEVGLLDAERALTLADELGLDRPADALGFRAGARAHQADPGSLDDFRDAIAVATEAGLGYVTAVLYNDYGVFLSRFEGDAAALEAYRAGIDFASTGGLQSMADWLTQKAASSLARIGQLDEALQLFAAVIDRAERTGSERNLLVARSTWARVETLRGHAAEIIDTVEWLESLADESNTAYHNVSCLGPAVLARAALGEKEAAAAHLERIADLPGVHQTGDYISDLAAFVRTALALGKPELAEVLADLLQRHTPHSPAAAAACLASAAALDEARGDLEAAARCYADAAESLQHLAAVPEQGYALLGLGRVLTVLGRASEEPLMQARAIFEALQAAPALAETDAVVALADVV
jgi:class 3 adenylate cyclase/tetratricopeptide (TPR) repeat protein